MLRVNAYNVEYERNKKEQKSNWNLIYGNEKSVQGNKAQTVMYWESHKGNANYR